MKSSHRPAAVAGLFYPEEPEVCRQQVKKLLEQANQAVIEDLQALISPHAGYIYSGAVAAAAFRALPARQPRQPVAIFGPNHRVPLRGMALDDHAAFETPLGAVPVATGLVAALAELEDVAVHNAAHAGEHCIEVQLPFLQACGEDFELIPVLVGDCQARTVAGVMQVLWEEGATILVSSDLSHFLPYDEANQLDRATSQAICAGNTVLEGQQACGCRAINGLNTLAAERGWQASLLALNNSGDSAGDKQRVVGYGAYAYH